MLVPITNQTITIKKVLFSRPIIALEMFRPMGVSLRIVLGQSPYFFPFWTPVLTLSDPILINFSMRLYQLVRE